MHNYQLYSVTNKSSFFLIIGFKPQALPSVLLAIDPPSMESYLQSLTIACNKILATYELIYQTIAAHSHYQFIPFSIGDT